MDTVEFRKQCCATNMWVEKGGNVAANTSMEEKCIIEEKGFHVTFDVTSHCKKRQK